MVAAGDELGGEQDGDDLEDVRRAAGGQGQRRDAEQDDEEDREALLLEQLDEAADVLSPSPSSQRSSSSLTVAGPIGPPGRFGNQHGSRSFGLRADGMAPMSS